MMDIRERDQTSGKGGGMGNGRGWVDERETGRGEEDKEREGRWSSRTCGEPQRSRCDVDGALCSRCGEGRPGDGASEPSPSPASLASLTPLGLRQLLHAYSTTITRIRGQCHTPAVRVCRFSLSGKASVVNGDAIDLRPPSPFLLSCFRKATIRSQSQTDTRSERRCPH